MITFTDLLELVEKRADAKYNGHLMMVRFTTGWKVVYGTPSLQESVPILQAIDDTLSLRDALHLAIIQEPAIYGDKE